MKYELAISENYVHDWTIVDAAREIFQNALDQEIVDPTNKMFCDYDCSNVLRVGNKNSVLETKSLLLGMSTKRDDAKTIGKFGEGYKIATLVLLRLGKRVTIYNYGANETWIPLMLPTKKYGGESILTFMVNSVRAKSAVNAMPDHDLTFAIEGITPDEYQLIVDSNLHLQVEMACILTNQGRILTSAKHASKVYVNGLWVCDYKHYKCGYDFKPENLPLDRDRKLVSDWDLRYLSSRMWAGTNNPKVAELAAQGAADVAYVEYHASQMYTPVIVETAYNDFREKYGEKAVPVINQWELASIDEDNYEAVIVPESYQKLIKKSPSYTEPVAKSKPEPEIPICKRLEVWFDTVQANVQVPDDLVTEFESILKDMEE